MRTTVDHVEERHGQHAGARAAEVAVQRDVEVGRSSCGGRQRHAEHGVRAEVLQVRSAVEQPERLVETPLVERVAADDLGSDAAGDRRNGLAHTLAAVAVVAVAEFVRLERAGRRAGRNGRSPARTRCDGHVDLDRRVAP